jgi:hypothetical protein
MSLGSADFVGLRIRVNGLTQTQDYNFSSGFFFSKKTIKNVMVAAPLCGRSQRVTIPDAVKIQF